VSMIPPTPRAPPPPPPPAMRGGKRSYALGAGGPSDLVQAVHLSLEVIEHGVVDLRARRKISSSLSLYKVHWVWALSGSRAHLSPLLWRVRGLILLASHNNNNQSCFD